MGLEYCPNGELYEQLEVRGPLAPRDAAQWAAEIVDVLGYLRSMEVIHRRARLGGVGARGLRVGGPVVADWWGACVAVSHRRAVAGAKGSRANPRVWWARVSGGYAGG